MGVHKRKSLWSKGILNEWVGMASSYRTTYPPEVEGHGALSELIDRNPQKWKGRTGLNAVSSLRGVN